MSYFSLTRFSLPPITPRYILFSRDAKLVIDGAFGGRLEIEFGMRSSNLRISGEAELHAQIPMKRNTSLTVDGSAIATLNWIISRRAQLDIVGHATMAKVMGTKRDAELTIDGRSQASLVIHFQRNAHMDIGSEVHAGLFIPFKRNSSLIVMSVAAGAATRYQTFRLSVEIPPGGEVRIDSDIFTAIKIAGGFENILHLFEGDWIYITRDTHRIIVTTDTGEEIQGEVIYNERYI